MFDCHFHTNRSYCADSDMSMEAAAEAVEISDYLEGVLITDHTFAIYFPKDVAWSWAYMSDPSVFDEYRDFGSKRLEAYFEDIESMRHCGLFAGLETELMPDGRFTFDPRYRDDLDALIGSVHFLPIREDADEEEKLELWRKNTSGLINGGIDILGHPFRFVSNFATVTEEMVRDVVTEAVEADVALELNSHYEIAADIMMLHEVRRLDGTLALSTDSHRRDEIGNFSYHEQLLKAIGLEWSDFNLYTLSD